MRRGNDAEFLRQPECGVKFFIGNSERALVGEKDFEAADSALNDLLKIALRFGITLSSAVADTPSPLAHLGQVVAAVPVGSADWWR